MRRLSLYLVAVLLLATASAALAQESVGSIMAGPGATITSPSNLKPDVNGLAVILSEPNASDEPWAAVVVNLSGEVREHISVKFEIEIDGQWYSAKVPSDAYVYPVVLQPGQFGIATIDDLGHGDEDWDDARATTTLLEATGESLPLIDLDIEQIDETTAGYFVGTVRNNTHASAGEIGIYLRCVTPDGIVKRQSFGDVDVRRLDPSQIAEFDFIPYRDDLCPTGSELAAAAVGVDRDAS